MKNKISTAIMIIFSLLVSTIGIGTAKADYRVIDPANFAREKSAILFFSEPQEISDSKYSIKLMIDTGGQSANSLLAYLSFSKDTINIEAINEENSICDFFLEDSFDNEQGVMNITCGKPYPGFNTKAEVVEITFTKNNIADTNFNFMDALVLANDGYATNILLEAKD